MYKAPAWKLLKFKLTKNKENYAQRGEYPLPQLTQQPRVIIFIFSSCSTFDPPDSLKRQWVTCRSQAVHRAFSPLWPQGTAQKTLTFSKARSYLEFLLLLKQPSAGCNQAKWSVQCSNSPCGIALPSAHTSPSLKPVTSKTLHWWATGRLTREEHGSFLLSPYLWSCNLLNVQRWEWQWS